MNQKIGISIELGDAMKQGLADVVRGSQKKHRWLSYADVRVNLEEAQAASAQNGMLKESGRDYGLGISVRVLAGEAMQASGYYGISLGPTDVRQFFPVVENAVRISYERALANASHKAEYKEQWGDLGKSLWSTRLASVPVREDTIPAEYRMYPMDVSLDVIKETAKSVSHDLLGVSDKMKFAFSFLATWVERELFVSSEGALIDQTFCYTQGLVYAVARHNGVSQSHYDYLGHQRGWEIIEDGIHEEYMSFPNYRVFAENLALDACELTLCPPCPWTDAPVTVVTDPHYNTLKVHEIVGHPTELDRILKMEAAYAGRSWLANNLTDTFVGKRVGSELVNAYSDPSLPGFGHYVYDNEGTPAKKVWHIRNGILEGFMNSRQTSAILGDEPNGHWKANGDQVVPLVRMSNTVFAKGDRDPKDIIGEVKRGYYLSAHRTPSIAESRENFRITARKVWEIRDGKLETLYRDGGIMADSKDYFMNVDAVGNDFLLFPIPNCGKGQPMQVKRLGNGGPTMRSRAKLTGPREVK